MRNAIISCKKAFKKIIRLSHVYLLLLCCYILSMQGAIKHIISGSGDVIGRIQSIMDIGAFKLLIIAIPAGAAMSIRVPKRERDLKLLPVAVFAIRCYIISGLCAFIGLLSYALWLMQFLPIMIDTASFVNAGFHIAIYLRHDSLLPVFFHALLLFAASGFAGMVLGSTRLLTTSNYLPFPVTFSVLQGISILGNIQKWPNHLRFSTLYSGYFQLFDYVMLDILWVNILLGSVGLFCCMMAFIFAKLKKEREV